MAKLTANQESFIKLMTKSDEHARRGFELLVARGGFEDYFEALAGAGLFDVSRSPAAVPATEPGYYRIPYWDALTYLEAVARIAGERADAQLGEKVMNVVRAVSGAREPDGALRDNYHTYRKFADILGLVPTTVVTHDDVDLIPGWLEGKFERGMVGHSLGKGALPRFLASDLPDDWSKACRVLEHCTLVRWIRKEGLVGERTRPVTVVADHWLKKLIDRNAEGFGGRAGQAAAEIFIARLRDVFRQGEHESSSWLSRPAVEDHPQNYSWHGPENRFVEGLRDVLLSWIDRDAAAAKPFIQILLFDEAEIVRRIAIHAISKRWEAFGGDYLQIVGPRLFDAGHLHELYGLLRDHFHEFSEPEKAATVDAIRQLPRPSKGEDPTRRLKSVQRRWLSAVAGKGYEPADAWFKELSSDPTLGAALEHPDLHTYMESWSGPGASPYSVQELLAFAEEGSIVDRLNGFEESGSWRGPTTRALVAAVEEAIGRDPEAFLPLLETFLGAKRPFQYGLISGFKRVWDLPKDKQPQIDWGHIWNELVQFFEQLIGEPAFWAEQVVEDRDLTPNRDWIPPVIAEFLRAGTRDDEKAYDPGLFPKTWLLIEALLDRLAPVASADEGDAMTQAINSAKGKAIEAFFSHALRTCRVSDRASGGHAEPWELIRPVLERELAKCRNANYEFSTLAGAYVANIQYIHGDWLRDNLDLIFPQGFPSNNRCALDGLAYAPATRPLYALLVESGVLLAALREQLKGRHTREKLIERMALGYLWGDDELSAPRFSYLFESKRLEDLEEASAFLWSISNQELSEAQVERILTFWERCVTWSQGLPEVPGKLLSSLSRLSCYLKAVGAREAPLLKAVAPYVHVGYNADDFIEQLDRLANVSPVEVSVVLGQVLNAYTPDFDFEDRLKTLLTKLAERGQRADAIAYAERLRYLPGMLQFYTQLITGR